MKEKLDYQQSGFFRIIVAIILIAIILTLLNIDIRQVIRGELWQSDFSTVKEILLKIIQFLVNFWHQYLQNTVLYVWQNIIKPLYLTIISLWPF